MRKSGAWMSIWDDRILEYISQEESGSPSEIAKNKYFHVSKQHISRRLRKLADHGLLKPLGNGVYCITDEGKKYLNGRYDAEREESISESKYRYPTTHPSWEYLNIIGSKPIWLERRNKLSQKLERE